MKIGLTGPQGAGKTTLAQACLQDFRFQGWSFIPSSARRAALQGFKVNQQAGPLDQLITTVGRITAEYQAPFGNTISDRTPLDSLAYTAYQYQNEWKDFDNTYYWDVSVALVQKSMAEYDHVFYCPPYWEPKEDGLRSTDKEYQTLIDMYIKALLSGLNVKYHTVPNGTNAERVDYLTLMIK